MLPGKRQHSFLNAEDDAFKAQINFMFKLGICCLSNGKSSEIFQIA